MAAIPNKRRFPIFVAALLLVGAATVILWLILDRPATGIDDADIFLVYARHLSVGDGFVFNAGGEHVEGFTSLLWVLICTVAVHLTTHPEPILLITSVVLLAIAITACLTSPIFKRKDG